MEKAYSAGYHIWFLLLVIKWWAGLFNYCQFSFAPALSETELLQFYINVQVGKFPPAALLLHFRQPYTLVNVYHREGYHHFHISAFVVERVYYPDMPSLKQRLNCSLWLLQVPRKTFCLVKVTYYRCIYSSFVHSLRTVHLLCAWHVTRFWCYKHF